MELARRLCVMRLGRCVRPLPTRRWYATEAAAVSGNELVLTFSTPSELHYNRSLEVQQVDVPTTDGIVGILAKHVPVIGVLAPGLMTVHEKGGANKQFFVSSGSLAVNEDSTVQVLAEEAVPVEQLDADETRKAMDEIRQGLASAADEKAKTEAEIQIGLCEAVLVALGSK